VALGEYMNFKFLIARICYPGWWFLKVQTKETFKGGGGGAE